MKKISFTTKIFLALLLGAGVGILLDFVPPGMIRDRIFVNGIFLIGGKLFMNAFKMMVVPIVFVSLTLGIAAMNSPKNLGRIGVKTIGFYLMTTIFAIVTGLCFAWFLSPGTGLDPERIRTAAEAVPNTEYSLIRTLSEIVPENPVRAFSGSSMFQIIFLAIVSGIALSLLGEKVPHLKKLLEELNLFNIKIIEMIMLFAPVGIFCLLGRTFATFGATAFLPLVKFLFCVALAMAFWSSTAARSMTSTASRRSSTPCAGTWRGELCSGRT